MSMLLHVEILVETVGCVVCTLSQYFHHVTDAPFDMFWKTQGSIPTGVELDRFGF